MEDSDFETVGINASNFNYSDLSIYDRTKVTVSEAISYYIQSDPGFNEYLFGSLINQDKSTSELLYIAQKDNVISNNGSLEQYLLNYYQGNEEKKQLISSIEENLPNLVVKIPIWTEVLLKSEDLKLEFATYPCLTEGPHQNLYFIDGKGFMDQKNNPTVGVVSQYVPIQVKESERLIPVELSGSKTFWGNDFYKDNFPGLDDCNEFNLKSYSVHQNSKYLFIDKIEVNDVLLKGAICKTPIGGGENVACEAVYPRDCVTEKNVIEGIKLSNLATFIGINNQPGGEDVMSLHYQFSVASMCGDLQTNEFCPPTDWKLVFFGRFIDFFEVQAYNGSPTNAELSDVIFRGRDYYVKAFPIYYDIPIDFSDEGIYSQARYLPLAEYGTWDGNQYGDAISMAIYEHDDVVVSATYSKDIKVTNTTKVSAKLSSGEDFEAGADFSNSVTRTSSTSFVIDASKDVELGKTACNYYERNYHLPNNGYGFNKTTGAVNTHFAFYD